MDKNLTIEYNDKINKTCLRKTEELLNILPPYCETFIIHQMDITQPRTRLSYVNDIKIFFYYLLQTNPTLQGKTFADIELSHLEQLNANDFDEYLIWLSHYEMNGTVYENSRKTKKRKMASLRTFFAFLYKREYLSSDPCAKADLPKVQKKDRRQIRILEGYETDLLFETIAEKYKQAKVACESATEPSPRLQMNVAIVQRDYVIINLFLYTGIRISELCAISTSDINFKLNRINIIRKGGIYDDICFSDYVKELLQVYIADGRETLSPNADNNDALFISSKHARISPRAVEMLVKNYADISLGEKNGITPHRLRATFGNNYYKMTNDIYATKEVMGHESVDVTASIYTRKDSAAKEQMKHYDLRVN